MKTPEEYVDEACNREGYPEQVDWEAVIRRAQADEREECAKVAKLVCISKTGEGYSALVNHIRNDMADSTVKKIRERTS